MGGNHLDDALNQVREQRARRRAQDDRHTQIARDVRDLQAEYPGYAFRLILVSGKVAIEAVRRNSTADPYAVIRDTRAGIREALAGHTGCGIDHAELERRLSGP